MIDEVWIEVWIDGHIKHYLPYHVPRRVLFFSLIGSESSYMILWRKPVYIQQAIETRRQIIIAFIGNSRGYTCHLAHSWTYEIQVHWFLAKISSESESQSLRRSGYFQLTLDLKFRTEFWSYHATVALNKLSLGGGATSWSYINPLGLPSEKNYLLNLNS